MTIEIKLKDNRYHNGIKWYTDYSGKNEYWNENKEVMIYNIERLLSPRQRKNILEIYYDGERIK